MPRRKPPRPPPGQLQPPGGNHTAAAVASPNTKNAVADGSPQVALLPPSPSHEPNFHPEDKSQQTQNFSKIPRVIAPFQSLYKFFVRHWILLLILVILLFVQTHRVTNKLLSVLPAGLRTEESERPGLLFNETIKVRHPVVILPGMLQALELWQARDCARVGALSWFRSRLFGALLPIFFADPFCFLEHFSLSRNFSHQDPPGIKIRPAPGLYSADFFLPTYWVWAKVIIALADLGYDPNNLRMMSYDWRLSPEDLELRDRSLTRLRYEIEQLHQHHGAKVVILTHSYGVLVGSAFLRWIDQISPGWTDEHVQAVAFIGAPFLGAAKAASALLSGDAKDIASLPPAIKLFVDARVPHWARVNVVRTWSSLYELYPRGPEGLWPAIFVLHNRLMGVSAATYSLNESLRLLREEAIKSGHNAMFKALEQRRDVVPTFPVARKLSIYCMYGTGLRTELGFEYDAKTMSFDETAGDEFGIKLGDGDATIPAFSAAYHCRPVSRYGWHRNVKGARAVEYPHSEEGGLRGPRTGEHVDVLGNYELIAHILSIVTGNGHLVPERVLSAVDQEIAAKETPNV